MSDPIQSTNSKNTRKLEKAPSTPANRSGDAPDIVEIGGVKGPEPTRYGDWEKKGRCIDF